MQTAKYIVAFILVTIGIAVTIRLIGFKEHAIGKEKGEDKITNVVSAEEESDNNGKADISADQKIKSEVKVEVIEEYKLPDILQEISGLVYLDANRFACVQDELGTIFIYDIKKEEVVEEIRFTKPGDFEGLTIVGKDAFALRSDGTIFQVVNYASKEPTTIEHKTHLTAKQNCEGIIYDKKNHRLLVTIKESEPDSDKYKGIYSMSLKNFDMPKEPVFKINLENPILSELKRKKDGTEIKPSGIGIHPINGDMYVVEGVKPKLLIMDRSGKIKSVTELNKKDFNQPEGITFSPDGQLFISNEGGKGPGNIMKVKLSGN